MTAPRRLLVAAVVAARRARRRRAGARRRHSAAGRPRRRSALAGHCETAARCGRQGLRWRPGALPAGDRLLSFEVAYVWRSCARPPAGGARSPPARGRRRSRPGATSSRTPTPAAGSSSSRRRPRSSRPTRRRSRSGSCARLGSVTTAGTVARLPARPGACDGVRERPAAAEHRLGEERFAVSAPHFNAADGRPRFATASTGAPGRTCRPGRVVATGRLGLGSHRIAVRASNSAGTTTRRFALEGRAPPRRARRVPGDVLVPPHLDSTGHPMRWDWQIGRVAPLERTGAGAVDLYDIDGFLTTRGPGAGAPHDAGRRARCRTRGPPATSTWPGRTTGRTAPRRRAASRPARSARSTTATRRSGGSTCAACPRSCRARRADRACAPERGSTRSRSTTSTASTRRRRRGFSSRGATSRTSSPVSYNRIHRARHDRPVEELGPPRLVGPPLHRRRGRRGVLPVRRVLLRPARREPAVRVRVHRPWRGASMRLRLPPPHSASGWGRPSTARTGSCAARGRRAVRAIGSRPTATGCMRRQTGSRPSSSTSTSTARSSGRARPDADRPPSRAGTARICVVVLPQSGGTRTGLSRSPDGLRPPEEWPSSPTGRRSACVCVTTPAGSSS